MKTSIVGIILFAGVLLLLLGGVMGEENKRAENIDPWIFLTFSKA